MSDVSVWLEDEWDDRCEAYAPRVVTGMDRPTFVWAEAGLPSPDETGGMTLAELLPDDNQETT